MAMSDLNLGVLILFIELTQLTLSGQPSDGLLGNMLSMLCKYVYQK